MRRAFWVVFTFAGVLLLIGGAHMRSSDGGQLMNADDREKCSSSKSKATLPASGGSGVVESNQSSPSSEDDFDAVQSPPPSRADKAIPIGTPLPPKEIDRLKREAERPQRVPSGSEGANKDSSGD